MPARTTTDEQIEACKQWVLKEMEAGNHATYAQMMEGFGVSSRVAHRIAQDTGCNIRPGHHILTSSNEETMTGVCSECGPVKLQYRHRGAGKKQLCCGIKNNWRHKGYSKRPHGLNNRQALELKAGRKCEVAICDKPAANVDHCHDTLNIRGVLCRDHNLALGYVHDSIEELEGLIDYLKMTTGVDGLARLGYAG